MTFVVFEPFGKQFGRGRCEHDVDAERRQQGLVFVRRSRVRLELCGVHEPQRIDESRHHDDLGDFACAMDEIDMAIVERTDGGDERRFWRRPELRLWLRPVGCATRRGC